MFSLSPTYRPADPSNQDRRHFIGPVRVVNLERRTRRPRPPLPPNDSRRPTADGVLPMSDLSSKNKTEHIVRRRTYAAVRLSRRFFSFHFPGTFLDVVFQRFYRSRHRRFFRLVRPLKMSFLHRSFENPCSSSEENGIN